MIKERPARFRGPEVRAILADRKTQHRWVVQPQPKLENGSWFLDDGKGWETQERYKWPCSWGQPRDRLWVRETFAYAEAKVMISSEPERPAGSSIGMRSYRASCDQPKPPCGKKWKPSIFMPRALSRITLEIVSVRAERLQEISEEDAWAEGFDREIIPPLLEAADRGRIWPIACNFRELFALGWDSINAKRGFGWAANPWVWVVEFKRVSAFPEVRS